MHIPVSVKALTAAVISGVSYVLLNVLHVGVSDSVKGVIASVAGFAVAYGVKEGVPYINKWLSDNGLPVDFDPEA